MRKKQRISTFNAACFALAAVLFSYSILSETPGTLAIHTRAMLGSVVGASASVAPNPDNTLAAELKQKEDELAAREGRLNVAENEIQNSRNDMAVYSFLLSGILFVVVGVNFYLDWRRGRTRNPFAIVVPKT